jgi:large subunit ribosomal protein L29
MKTKEIRELSADEIRGRLREEEEQLGQFRFQHAVGTLQSPAQLRTKRRLIAQLKTVLKEKEQAV